MIEKIPNLQQINMKHEDIEMSNPKSKVFCKKNSVDDMFREIPTTSKLIKTEPEDIMSNTKIKKPRFDKEEEEEDEIGKDHAFKK